MATNADFDMLRQRKSPSKKKSKKCGAKVSVIIEGVYTIGLCLSKFLFEEI